MPSIQLLGSLWVCVFVLIILCDSVDVGAGGSTTFSFIEKHLY